MLTSTVLPIPLWTMESEVVGEDEIAAADVVPQAERPADAVPVESRKGIQNLDSWVWIASVLVVLTAAFFLEVRAEGRVGIWGQEWVLPESCFTRYRLGFPCPGCGLTRSFIHVTHGEFAAAWQVNWTGCLLFVYACIQLPLALTHAFTPYEARRKPGVFRKVIRCNELAIIGVLVLLFGRWVFLVPYMFAS